MSEFTYYIFKSHRLLSIAEKSYARRKEVLQKIKKFQKRYNLEDYAYSSDFGGGFTCVGFYINPKVTPLLGGKSDKWKKSKSDVWSPRKNLKANRGLIEEIETFRWSPADIKEAINWKDIWVGTTFHTYSPFFDSHKGIYGFMLRTEVKNKYKPVIGIKEVKPSWYAKHFED